MKNHLSGWRTALFACLLALPAWAVETRVWDQSEMADFSRGTIKDLALRSDGHLTLGASPKELDSTSIPYLWALARDSAGTIYYAGGAPTGATTKIFRLPRNGRPSLVADVPGLEIHALAVDKQDRVYAAVLPDAKVYRIDKTGKPQLFFDPKCKYIWAMAFDASGNLFLGTGDTGTIYRVTPDGTGAKFYDSEDNHVRSMVIDSAGNLIVGTEPSGLVIRITPAGQSFVLYETNRREVTAVAEYKGQIYAASVGSKTSPPVVTGPPPVLPPSNPTPATGAGTPRPATPPTAPPALGSISASITGGSEVYRIDKDGFAERIWQSSSDLAYALGFDTSGHVLVGTGNKGMIYRIDSPQLWTQLATLPPSQVTAFLQETNGALYVATGNVGNLYLLSSGSAITGTLTSDVLDARDFTYWGKAHVTADRHDGSFTLETRSGNLNNPENNWSAWSLVKISPEGGQVQSPPARFLQYRLTLTCEGAVSPELSAIDVAYLPKNIAPRMRAIDIAPLNYRQSSSSPTLERNVNAAGSPTSLTVPAVGQKRATVPGTSSEGSGSVTLQYSKGFLTVRWAASDGNDDPLEFKLEMRPKAGTAWQTLKSRLTDRYYSFDTTSFPDGEYVVRITASDAPGNIPSEALSTSLESDPFRVDNTSPEITGLNTAPAQDGRTRVTWTAKDATSWISKAEYSLNGGEWTLVTPVNKVTDSQTLSYEVQVPAGQSLAIRVFDEDDNVQVRQVTLH